MKSFVYITVNFYGIPDDGSRKCNPPFKDEKVIRRVGKTQKHSKHFVRAQTRLNIFCLAANGYFVITILKEGAVTCALHETSKSYKKCA